MPDIKKLNNALKDNFKELDRAYLNTLGTAEQKLLAAYKTALDDVTAKIKAVYDKFGDTPTITQVRKANRLASIENQISKRIADLDKEVRNITSSMIKTTAVNSYSSFVNGINQGMQISFLDTSLSEQGLDRFLSDTLWSDAMKNANAQMWSNTKRDFETVLRANTREEILSGVAQGKSYAEISKDIQERFNVGATRAKTITFTETHKAHSYGRNEGVNDAIKAAEGSGVKVVKVWRHNAVGTPRPDHVEADGQIADKDGLFTVGGEQLEAPGLGTDPSNNINCHCSVELEVLDEPANLKAIETTYSSQGVDFGEVMAKQLPHTVETVKGSKPVSFGDIKMMQSSVKAKHNMSVSSTGQKFVDNELKGLIKQVDEAFIDIRKASKAIDDRMKEFGTKVKIHNEGGFNNYITFGKEKLAGYYDEVTDEIHIAGGVPGGEQLRLGKKSFSVSDGFKATVRHEFGHHMKVYSFGEVDSGGFEFRDIYQKLRKSFDWSKMSTKVSQYATTNEDEFFAECFSAITHPRYWASKNRLPQIVEDWFVEVFEIKRR